MLTINRKILKHKKYRLFNGNNPVPFLLPHKKWNICTVRNTGITEKEKKLFYRKTLNGFTMRDQKNTSILLQKVLIFPISGHS